MIVDFRMTRNKPKTISILGEKVKVFEKYRSLGVHLNSRLDIQLLERT